MANSNLQGKLLLWGEMKKWITVLEEEIKEKVLELKQNQEAGNVKASYSEGKGSYDWRTIADHLVIEKEIIDQNTPQPSPDWRAICHVVGVPKEIMEKFYTIGTPSVSLKLQLK